MEIVYQFRTNTTTKEIYIYIKVYKNRIPFIKQPIGSQVTKKKKEKGTKKNTPSKQSGNRKMEMVYQFRTNTTTKDIYIYQGLQKSSIHLPLTYFLVKQIIAL